MSTGLYPDNFVVDRNLASVTASTIFPPFVAPFDFDVLGMVLHLGTAPGANDGVIVNVSNSPTSQTGGGGTTVSAYNLWTTANAPSVLGTATMNWTANQSVQVVENIPYGLNYPLPGPSPVTGYATAQSPSSLTYTAVTSPPLVYKFSMNSLVVPDNTYTDYNGITLIPASMVHAGDVLSFVITAGGSSVSVGAAANLEIVLACSKR